MSFDITKLSIKDMMTLHQQMEERINQLREEVRAQHHSEFIEAVGGVDALAKISKVAAEQLKLEKCGKYPQGRVTPKMLGDESAVRSLDGQNRPIIAIKINLYDCETKKMVGQVVELIFKRHSIDGLGANGALYGENYVTALGNATDDGKHFQSGLYRSGGMIPAQWKRVGQLLRGEKIPHEFDKNLLMQRADLSDWVCY